jgi:hypothetical protein
METTPQQQPKHELTVDEQIEKFRLRCSPTQPKNKVSRAYQKGTISPKVSMVTDRFTYTNLL